MAVGFLRKVHGSAGIYFALGAGAMLTASALTFDLTRYVQLQGRAERAAITIADYASREGKVDCSEVRALAGFLRTETLGENASGVLALTAAAGDADEDNGVAEEWTWDPPVELRPVGGVDRLQQCRDALAERRTETLGALSMVDGEDVIMVQFCIAPDTGHFISPAWVQDTVGMTIYRHHVLPARIPDPTQVCT